MDADLVRTTIVVKIRYVTKVDTGFRIRRRDRSLELALHAPPIAGGSVSRNGAGV